jgi:hypothetical protein
VIRDIGVDGAVYARSDVTPQHRITDSGGTLWVACDGAILGRAYDGPAFEFAVERTVEIAI